MGFLDPARPTKVEFDSLSGSVEKTADLGTSGHAAGIATAQTFTALQTLSAGVAIQGLTTIGSTSQDPRVPFKSSQGVNSAQGGLNDHVGHLLQTIVAGAFAESIGADPNFAWGIDAFTTTGTAAGDADGIASLVNLFETAIRTPSGTLGTVVGLQGEATIFGATANPTITSMISLRAARPRRNGGATAGTTVNAYSLYVDKAVAADTSATNAYSVKVVGGYTEINGNAKFIAELAGETPLTVKMAPTPSVSPIKLVNTFDATLFSVNTAGGVGASSSVIAREGQGTQVAIGAHGPGGEAAIVVGSATDTVWYRSAADTWRTPDSVIVDSTLTSTGVFTASDRIYTATIQPLSGNLKLYGDTGGANAEFDICSPANGGHVRAKLATTNAKLAVYDGSADTFSVSRTGLPKWEAAANQQTTVGAAGGASALPATPTKYLKVVDSTGATLVVPAFAAA